MELESRLHALTESLILKQTMLESLGTEKNSLVLQLERMDVGGTTSNNVEIEQLFMIFTGFMLDLCQSMQFLVRIAS